MERKFEVVFNIIKTEDIPPLKKLTYKKNQRIKNEEGLREGYFIKKTKEQMDEVLKSWGLTRPGTSHISEWCHPLCYKTVEYGYHEPNPVFNGLCRKDCDDKECSFKHGNYSW